MITAPSRRRRSGVTTSACVMISIGFSLGADIEKRVAPPVRSCRMPLVFQPEATQLYASCQAISSAAFGHRPRTGAAVRSDLEVRLLLKSPLRSSPAKALVSHFAICYTPVSNRPSASAKGSAWRSKQSSACRTGRCTGSCCGCGASPGIRSFRLDRVDVVDRYFDTADGRLLAADYSCRLRTQIGQGDRHPQGAGRQRWRGAPP